MPVLDAADKQEVMRWKKIAILTEAAMKIVNVELTQECIFCKQTASVLAFRKCPNCERNKIIDELCDLIYSSGWNHAGEMLNAKGHCEGLISVLKGKKKNG